MDLKPHLGAGAIDWLLASDEPGVVLQVKRDLLGERDPPEAAGGCWTGHGSALLAGQQANGRFGVITYGKWGGAHWRLVSLVELGVPAGEPRCLAAAETVLAWLTGKSHRAAVKTIDGLVRRCASPEGNALAVCCRLDLAEDPRVRLLAESLVEWQWPDGGWNCDRRATGRRSSFHESLAPMWGLHEYSAATGEDAAKEGAGTTMCSRRCWCSPGWASRATRAPRTLSNSWTRAASRTAAGAPAGVGGSRRARRAATSRSSTGADPARTRW